MFYFLQDNQAALSLPGFQRITIRRCYSELFAHGIAPEPFHNALRQNGLLAGRFRNRLILHAGDKVTGASCETALLEVLCQPGAGSVTTPLPFSSRHSRMSVMSYSAPSVTACTDSRWLPARRCMLVVI